MAVFLVVVVGRLAVRALVGIVVVAGGVHGVAGVEISVMAGTVAGRNVAMVPVVLTGSPAGVLVYGLFMDRFVVDGLFMHGLAVQGSSWTGPP